MTDTRLDEDQRRTTPAELTSRECAHEQTFTKTDSPIGRHARYAGVEHSWSCWDETSSATGVDITGVADVEVFRQACEHFRHDITAYWTQASFFALLQGAFVSFFASTIGGQNRKAAGTALVDARAECVFIAFAGLVFALLWWEVARGRQKYIDLWRKAVVHLDGVVDRHGVYITIERRAGSDPHNPTRITDWVPWIFVAGWLAAITWGVFFAR